MSKTVVLDMRGLSEDEKVRLHALIGDYEAFIVPVGNPVAMRRDLAAIMIDVREAPVVLAPPIDPVTAIKAVVMLHAIRGYFVPVAEFFDNEPDRCHSIEAVSLSARQEWGFELVHKKLEGDDVWLTK